MFLCVLTARRSSSLTNEHHSSRHAKRRQTKHQITYYELLELERQKNEANTVKVRIKQNFPIAPDGFIPNSVIRKFFALLEAPPKPAEKTIWKLKWRPPVNETLTEVEEKNLEGDRNSPEFVSTPILTLLRRLSVFKRKIHFTSRSARPCTLTGARTRKRNRPRMRTSTTTICLMVSLRANRTVI